MSKLGEITANIERKLYYIKQTNLKNDNMDSAMNNASPVSVEVAEVAAHQEQFEGEELECPPRPAWL